MPGLWITLLVFTALYLLLGVVVVGMLRAHVFAAPHHDEAPASLVPPRG